MKVPWRVTLLGSLAVYMCAASAPAVAVAAGPGGGGGGLPSAGSYQSTNQNANLFVSGPYPATQLSISVNANTNVSRPEGGTPSTSSETDVFVSLQDYNDGIFGSGCFILTQPSDFTLASDLSSAHLKTTFTSATPTCFGTAFLPFPFSVDATWNGAGPVNSFQDESRYQCLTYHSETTLMNHSVSTAASATISGFASPFIGNQNGLSSVDQRINAEGVGQPSCPPFGGKGVGAGPLAAGTYRFSGPHIGASFGGFPGPLMFISVSDVTRMSHPEGSPSTSNREIDLFFQTFGGGVDGSGCWVISPSDFKSSGVSSASLQTTVTDTTPTCPFPGPPGGTGIPLPLTLNVTWTGTGPVVTVHDDNVSTCPGFSEESQSLIRTNSATAAATVTEQQSTSTLSGGQGSLSTGDQRIQVEGQLCPRG